MLKIVDWAEYKKTVETGQLVIVRYYSKWSGPCRLYKSVFRKLAENTEELMLDVNIDPVDEETKSTDKVEVPNVLIFKNGKKLGNVLGYLTDQELSEFVKGVLNREIFTLNIKSKNELDDEEEEV